ncbi:TKL protein kinase, variant [Trichuris trichiura]|uniref:TKL protein kinase, variant n=1 Tax=Trichuris trichiura TaxID=36087 RepID=A0A077YY10_TRITR|nr:TKL protein kinase, variant [Trichuris trichiura]
MSSDGQNADQPPDIVALPIGNNGAQPSGRYGRLRSFPDIDGDVFGGHMVAAKEIGHVRRSARIVVYERTCTVIDKQKCCASTVEMEGSPGTTENRGRFLSQEVLVAAPSSTGR